MNNLVCNLRLSLKVLEKTMRQQALSLPQAWIGQRTFKTLCGNPKIGTVKDSSVIVCWHPEELDFPYEHTKRITRTEADRISYNSESDVLKSFPEKRDFSNEELMKMFYTTKHEWFPKPGKRYMKSKVIRDREGL